MIVLYEETGHTSSPLAQDSAITIAAARAQGLEVHPFSSDFDIFGTAEEALDQIPPFAAPTSAVWIGFIPAPDRYRSIYDAARAKNIFLVNDPDAYQLTTEFDRFYPCLGELTPRSAIVTDLSQCDGAIAELGLPLFVKGVVRSARTKGWKACVAESDAELRGLVTDLLGMEARSRGRVVLRRFARLRHARVTEHGFPLGREYRVILHGGTVLGHGYYWEGEDPLSALTPDEEKSVLDLAREAARRVGARFMTVDVGELEAGGWIVIETGDPQFAGWSTVPREKVFAGLKSVAP